jgi:hypothetical protein
MVWRITTSMGDDKQSDGFIRRDAAKKNRIKIRYWHSFNLQ